MQRILVAVALIAVFTGAFACSAHRVAWTDAPPGTIRGRVTDPEGAPLPGVTVTVSRDGFQQTLITDNDGLYAVANLQPGTYTVKTELSGLNAKKEQVTITSKGVQLVTKLNFEATQTITVTASSPGAYVARSAATANDPWTILQKVPGTQADSINIGGNEKFAHFEDHAEIQTRKEHVTTFSIDVDRASYANVRRYLTHGLVPPPDAVRVEEMINYFTYHLPQPAGAEPFSITTEVTGCPWNARNRLLRIGIQGRNLDEWRMAPNNLVFLLDVSGSMKSMDRLPLVKSGLRVLVDQLRAEDRVAIVVYAGAAGLVLPPTSGADKQTILAALDQLQAGGSTAGGEGIELAYKVARDNFLADGNNRVILATDGDFNVGPVLIDDLQKLIEEKRKSGVYLSVIGVGEDNRDELMEMFADKGNGNYAMLDSQLEAEKVFRHELTGTLVTIAKDVKVQLDFDPSLVKSFRQIGYENRALANKDFEDDTADAGELGAGHSVTVLYELTPASSARGTIATIKLRYKEPKEETSNEITAAAVDEGKSAFDASSDMQFAAAIAEFGMLLRNSPHKGTASWDDALQLARIARGEDIEGTREEFLRMLDSAKRVTGPRVAVK